jgi:hypothetical protein
MIIAVLLREQAGGGWNITFARGSAVLYLVTASLLMPLLYFIYERWTNKGALYFYINRNIPVAALLYSP